MEDKAGGHIFPHEMEIANLLAEVRKLKAVLLKSRGRHMQRGDFDMQRAIDAALGSPTTTIANAGSIDSLNSCHFRMIRSTSEVLSMDEKTEQEFINQYEGYVARKVARDLYRALHPAGMHTNGPCRIQVEASHLFQLLKPFALHRGERP